MYLVIEKKTTEWSLCVCVCACVNVYISLSNKCVDIYTFDIERGLDMIEGRKRFSLFLFFG